MAVSGWEKFFWAVLWFNLLIVFACVMVGQSGVSNAIAALLAWVFINLESWGMRAFYEYQQRRLAVEMAKEFRCSVDEVMQHMVPYGDRT